MTPRIGPGMVVRWRADSPRRIDGDYSTDARYRVLGIRVVQQAEERTRLAVGDRVVIMQPLDAGGNHVGYVYRVHERDVERAS